MFDVGDAMNLPYDDGSLDACRAETLLQHLTDPHQAVHEMTRVTRPGGRAAIPESGRAPRWPVTPTARPPRSSPRGRQTMPFRPGSAASCRSYSGTPA